MKTSQTNKLTKLTLKLIQKDLRRIANFKVEDTHGFKHEPPPGMFAPILARYFQALNQHRRVTDKLEDEQREALKKLSIKELKKRAGVAEG